MKIQLINFILQFCFLLLPVFAVAQLEVELKANKNAIYVIENDTISTCRDTVITFQAITESKERKVKHQIKAIEKASRKTKDVTSRELTTRLKNMILSVDGESDETIIKNFVDNELFALDSQSLRAYINDVIPDIDLQYEFVSEETGERREMLLPMDAGFFWPSSNL